MPSLLPVGRQEALLRGLDDRPRLAAYLRANETTLRARHVAQRRPQTWWRTIDKVIPGLVVRAILLLPVLKGHVHPVLDPGGRSPHHNLCFVVSESWDLEVLGGLLLSSTAGLSVESHSVRMASGCLRFTAQYLRTIRVPDPRLIPDEARSALAAAFRSRDRAASEAAFAAYGLEAGRPRPKPGLLSPTPARPPERAHRTAADPAAISASNLACRTIIADL